MTQDFETLLGMEGVGARTLTLKVRFSADFRTITRSITLDEPTSEAGTIVAALGPLIDPNLHSCGSVPPHGVDELSHPDEGVFMVGMKSYGRAPTFLMADVGLIDGPAPAQRERDRATGPRTRPR